MEELITESKTNITNSTQNGHSHLASIWSKALEIFRDNVDNSAFKYGSSKSNCFITK